MCKFKSDKIGRLLSLRRGGGGVRGDGDLSKKGAMEVAVWGGR